MKKIEAIIQPFEVEAVKGALKGLVLKGITVTEVKGFGAQAGTIEIYRGVRYDAPYHSEAKVEIVVPDEMARRAVAIIREATETEEPGGERIFVSSLEDIDEPVTEKKRMAAV